MDFSDILITDKCGTDCYTSWNYNKKCIWCGMCDSNALLHHIMDFCNKLSRASGEIRTRDLVLTKDAQYP